jgi:hypothetical protein
MNYTAYEKKVLAEIRDWETARPGMIIKTIDMIGKPITLMISGAPGTVKNAVGKAIMGFMEMLKDLSYWTYTDKAVIKEAKKAGFTVKKVSDLQLQDIEKLDPLARRFFSTNKVLAALEGAGCGFGGLALIGADIPALFGIGFRSIQQIGSAYGFDMRNPDMLAVIMGIFNAGSGLEVAVKTSVLADMHIAAAALAGKAAYGKLAERTNTALLTEIIQKSARSLPSQLAENLTKRKLSQAIPIVGAAIGAGFNYWFMSTIVVSAYMVFRKLYIERKYAMIAAEEASAALKASARKPLLADRAD